MIQWDSDKFLTLDKKSGDRDRTQNALDYETDTAKSHLNDLRTDMIVPTTQNMFNNYMNASQNAFKDYGSIMGEYRGFLDDSEESNITADQISPSLIDYKRTKELGDALAGYGEFAKTGGFDENARRDIRARGVSPIRAAYGNTIRELDRARALGGSGGTSNYIAARSRAQRELPQQLSDATQNVNAGLAQMIQQGRLHGLGGLSHTAQADIGFGQRAKLANQDATMKSRFANQGANLAAAQFNRGSKLHALSGMSSLYSATPGQASAFGNQLLGSTSNWLNAQQLQNQLANTKISGQLAQSGIPTGFQSFLGNMGKVGDVATNFADLF